VAACILTTTITLTGCANSPGTVTSVTADVTPAGQPAAPVHTFPGVCAVDVAESNGSVHLILGTPAGPDGKDFVLAHTRSDDGGATWTEPVKIPTDHALPTKMHRGDDPQVAVRGDRVMALWTGRGDGPFGSGPIATELSDDGGRTWRPGPTPAAQPLPPGAMPKPTETPAARAAPPPASSHGSHAGSHKGSMNGTGPGYRFPAAAAGADGFHVVWIHAVGEERSLRHARLTFGASTFSEATVIDPKICACCWNELKAEPDGTILALYRDQEPSDMSLALSRDGGWSWQPAGHAGQFDWHFDGCPHVGGGIATTGRGNDVRILTTVWTGKSDSTGAYVVAATPRGEWWAPTPLWAAKAAGRNTDIAALPGTQAAAAVWDQSAPEGGQCVYAAFTADGGKLFGDPRRLSAPGENASYPRIVPARGRFVALWTRYGSQGDTTLCATSVRPREAR
jgi:hypothetical protein